MIYRSTWTLSVSIRDRYLHQTFVPKITQAFQVDTGYYQGIAWCCVSYQRVLPQWSRLIQGVTSVLWILPQGAYWRLTFALRRLQVLCPNVLSRSHMMQWRLDIKICIRRLIRLEGNGTHKAPASTQVLITSDTSQTLISEGFFVMLHCTVPEFIPTWSFSLAYFQFFSNGFACVDLEGDLDATGRKGLRKGNVSVCSHVYVSIGGPYPMMQWNALHIRILPPPRLLVERQAREEWVPSLSQDKPERIRMVTGQGKRTDDVGDWPSTESLFLLMQCIFVKWFEKRF